MAMGKAIIASNLEQLGEILRHNKTAYLVEPGNIKQLVEAMLLLIIDSRLRQSLGREAMAEVMKKFTWQKHVEKIFATLNDKRFIGSDI